MPQASYQRLSEKERETISRGLAAGEPYAVIARGLNRSTSSISREVKGNYGRTRYRAWPAGRKARKWMGRRRGGKSKLLASRRLCRYVESHLRRAWSPDEIARRLRV